MFERDPIELWSAASGVPAGEEYDETNRAVSFAASVTPTDTQQMLETNKAVTFAASITPTDTHQMLDTNKAVSFEANTTKVYTNAWFGDGHTLGDYIDSLCGQEDGTQLQYALNGANRWYQKHQLIITVIKLDLYRS